jgi:2-polyprenyl-3-methyl-5-hydroxy-6-metoxy-1,4-benzoquinol methylase
MNSTVFARWYLSLAPVSAPNYWRTPQPLECARMEYEDEIAGGFLKWFPRLNLRDKDVFDIGSGNGGRTVRYAELGARSVTGLEVFERCLEESRQFAELRGVTNTTFVLGAGEELPFPSRSFDIITSYDVFEHVCDLRKVLSECMRVLRPGGTLYAVFPPFYHPNGAHLDSWLSRMPYPNLLFSAKTLLRAGYDILQQRSDDYRPNPIRPSDRLWGLNGATIRSTRRLLDSLGCNYRLDLAPLCSPLNSKWQSWRMKYYAWAFAPLRHVPWLQEIVTHRMVLTLTT